MRFFYVASVPLGATLWLALLFFRRETRLAFSESEAEKPARIFEYSSRRAVVAATFFALMVCAALWFAFNWFAQQVLQTPILSPRPFVTRWVNLLVVEPNDNSFPSPEALLLGVLWIANWALSPRALGAAFALAISGCVARVFCGTHYVADVVVGLCVGAGVCALSMAFCGVVLRLSPQPFRQRAWRLRVQGAAGLAGVLAVLVFGVATLRQTPRLFAAWQERHLSSQIAVSPQPLRDIEYSNEYSKQKLSLAEGEGLLIAKQSNAPSSSAENTDAQGKAIPRVGVTTTGGFLPREEARLLRALQRLNLAHSLVSVDVAALFDNASRDNASHNNARQGVSTAVKNDKSFAMHFASVRFQVRLSNANERRRVAQTAQRVVQAAFANDSALQSIDIVGVVINAPQRDKVRFPVFAIGAIPVWTASVQRANLVSKKFAANLNSPNADAGLWLRARSRLYINERVLPRGEQLTPSPPLPLFKGKGDKLKLPTKNQANSVAPKPAATQKLKTQSAKTQAAKPSVTKTPAAKVAPRDATKPFSPAPRLQNPKSQKTKPALPQTLNEKSQRTSSTRSTPKAPRQTPRQTSKQSQLDAAKRAAPQTRDFNAKIVAQRNAQRNAQVNAKRNAQRNEKSQKLQQAKVATPFRAPLRSRGER